MPEPEHTLLARGVTPACSCGEWTPPLGKSISREFDKHLLEVRAEPSFALPLGMLKCKNTQCRVEVFRPFTTDRQPYCPSCYGDGS